MSNYHVPVMLKQCLEGLHITPNGTFVDVTFGGGGHSMAILQQLDKGRLIAFDQDDDAQENAIKDERFTLVNHNFRYLKRFLRYHEVIPVDGILADLGISSHQIDEPERGFAHRFNAELDMRMNRKSGLSAADILNSYEEGLLREILRNYGELQQPGRLASAIVASRAKKSFQHSNDLKEAIGRFAPSGKENQFYSQVFQALRIEVNGELDVLKELLTQSVEVLKPGGRLVIMSYHSLEDRLVKNFIQSGDFNGKETKDLYGNKIRPLLPVGKVVVANEEELLSNPRSRSARLRIAERL